MLHGSNGYRKFVEKSTAWVNSGFACPVPAQLCPTLKIKVSLSIPALSSAGFIAFIPQRFNTVGCARPGPQLKFTIRSSVPWIQTIGSSVESTHAKSFIPPAKLTIPPISDE